MSGNKLATTEAAPVSVYQVFDALDEQQIIDEIEGRIVDTWCYEVQGKTGLAKKGVDQCILEMGKGGWIFNELDERVVVDPGDDEYRLFSVKVQAFRYTPNGEKFDMGTVTGNKRQWVYQLTRDKKKEADPFWYEKGVAKAFRNAKMRFIPAEIEAAIIKLAKDGGKVKRHTERSQTRVVNGGSRQAVSKPEVSPEERKAERLKYLRNWIKREWWNEPGAAEGEDTFEICEKLSRIVKAEVESAEDFVSNNEYWDKFTVYAQELALEKEQHKEV